MRAGVRGRVDERVGELHVAVVVDAHLGGDEAGGARAEAAVADGDGRVGHGAASSSSRHPLAPRHSIASSAAM